MKSKYFAIAAAFVGGGAFLALVDQANGASVYMRQLTAAQYVVHHFVFAGWVVALRRIAK